MGLDINSVRFLIDARRQGVNFGEVLTLGRQDLNVYPRRLVELFAANGLPVDRFQGDEGKTLFAEPVFESLGAAKVHSLDASSFEGASYVHDLNLPVGPELKQKFDCVYDGGTLEHVFNFPVALKNCMEMVRPGGTFFIHTGTNNWCGHGFYQFSPELFFRALGPDNGFQVERMVLHMVGPYGRWYEVSDPDEIKARVELVTLTPVQLLVRARRKTVVPVFERMPQQSDYSPRWQDPAASNAVYQPKRPKLARVAPGLARFINVLRAGFALVQSRTSWNRRNFRPIKKP